MQWSFCTHMVHVWLSSRYLVSSENDGCLVPINRRQAELAKSVHWKSVSCECEVIIILHIYFDEVSLSCQAFDAVWFESDSLYIHFLWFYFPCAPNNIILRRERQAKFEMFQRCIIVNTIRASVSKIFT